MKSCLLKKARFFLNISFLSLIKHISANLSANFEILSICINLVTNLKLTLNWFKQQLKQN